MYSSLTKIDIVAERDGVRHFVQTDHRRPEEVEAEPEISVLFALTRSLLPRRMIREGDPRTVVRYAALAELHPKLARVLAATGAEAEAEGKPQDLRGVPKVPPADLAEEAFSGLARRVLARERLALDEAGLEALEASLAGTPTADEDEIAYWTSVAELAAVTGELLRARFGGRWVDDPKDYAAIPFMFKLADGEQHLNPVGKAEKFLDAGERESPRQLLKMAADSALEAGPALLTLKPSDWPGSEQAVCEPMMVDWEKIGCDVPLIVYGDDRPNSFAMYTKDGEREKNIPELRRRATANLVDIAVGIEPVALDELRFLVVHGSYYAAEKILDVEFMKTLHVRIGSEVLAAAVPRKGELLVTNAVVQPPTMFGFLSIVEGSHKKKDGPPPLSPTVFLVQEGKISGVVRPSEATPPPPKKGFLKRLFS